MKANANTAAVVFPSSSWARHAGLVLGGSIFLALVAQLSVPMIPVPITGQTFGILVLGLLYGSRLGALTVLAYLAEGAAGLPVFANGAGGVAVLVGPTAGYLWGFVVAAFAVGWLAERGWDRKVWMTAVAMLIGNIILYVPGLIWLRVALIPDWVATFQGGLIPFIPGDLLKLVLACCVVWGIRGYADRWRARRSGQGSDSGIAPAESACHSPGIKRGHRRPGEAVSAICPPLELS